MAPMLAVISADQAFPWRDHRSIWIGFQIDSLDRHDCRPFERKRDPMQAAPSTPSGVVSAHDQIRIVVGVLLVMSLAALDQTIVAPALPVIGSALGDVQYLTWIISIYFLTATAVTPLYGKLADIHGRRGVLLTAVSIFVIGSIACGLSQSMFWLIVGRAVQGLGGGAPDLIGADGDRRRGRAARSRQVHGLYFRDLGDGVGCRAGARRCPLPSICTGR